jgi:hypothetical protein
MNETTNKVTGETIKYNRIGGTPDNPIYFNDPTPSADASSLIPKEDLASFKKANPTLNFTMEDYNQYQKAGIPPATAISASSLTSNQPLVKVPNVQTQTPDTTDIVTRTQTQLDIAKQEADMLQGSVGTQAQEARKTLADTVKNLFTQRGQTQASQTALEEQAGIADEQKALREVNTEIANTNIQLRAEQDRIRNTPMSQAQRAVEIGAIQDTFGRRLADLAIRQSASQGNISAIQSDAERKVKLALAPIENQIQYFTTFGKDNVDALTQEQQQRLNLIVTSLNKQKEDVKALEEAKAKAILEVVNNGGGRDTAVISAIQGAKDISSAYTAGGKYIGALDREVKNLQIDKLRAEATKLANETGAYRLSAEDNARLNSTPQAKGINDGAKFASALQEYKDAIEKYGTGEVFGKGSGALGASYQAVVGAVKDYYQLGTLDNGVEKLVSLGIPKPSVWGLKAGRISGIDTTIQNVINNVERDVNQLSNTTYANSVEGQEIIQTGRLIAEKKKLSQASNEEFLNSINNESMSGSTQAFTNEQFFNR